MGGQFLYKSKASLYKFELVHQICRLPLSKKLFTLKEYHRGNALLCGDIVANGKQGGNHK